MESLQVYCGGMRFQSGLINHSIVPLHHAFKQRLRRGATVLLWEDPLLVLSIGYTANPGTPQLAELRSKLPHANSVKVKLGL